MRVIGVDSSPRDARRLPPPRASWPASPSCSTCGSASSTAPPVDERVALVTCPFRSFLHLLDDDARLRALARRARAARSRAGGWCSTSSRPSADDIADTHGRWLEREPGHLRARRLGLAGADADAVGARRERRDELRARVALERRVARAARAGGLPGRSAATAGSTAARTRRRGHGLGRAAAGLEQLDRVADGDLARLDDPRQHPALALRAPRAGLRAARPSGGRDRRPS